MVWCCGERGGGGEKPTKKKSLSTNATLQQCCIIDHEHEIAFSEKLTATLDRNLALSRCIIISQLIEYGDQPGGLFVPNEVATLIVEFVFPWKPQQQKKNIKKKATSGSGLHKDPDFSWWCTLGFF